MNDFKEEKKAFVKKKTIKQYDFESTLTIIPKKDFMKEEQKELEKKIKELKKIIKKDIKKMFMKKNIKKLLKCHSLAKKII